MITTDNFPALLLALNFQQHDKQYRKTFANDVALVADFEKKELIYPEAQGLKVHERQTCNFSANENFVVFECVHRLLEKGYKPEHIELEPKWKIGHGASGGRADIQIKDNDGNILLIIECKTAGEQFKKAWNNTLEDGGQLFGYAANAEPDFLSLYASDFNESENKLTPSYYLISLKDNAEFLSEDKNKDLPTFASSKKTREALFNVWKNTYQQEPITKGLFENSVPAYQLGQQKISLEDLQNLSSKDIQPKYHEFASIMRQHNISGRENAFDKLVNLFLCKIVDESGNSKKETEQQELQFYWKGFSYDNYFDLIDRLQNLYQKGMYQFLNEKVTYIQDNQVEEAFRYVKQKPDATRDTIKKFFKQLKYFTNNDFAFIDVHNENLFYQNAIVLLKMVRMLQDIKLLQHEQKNQFLGDLFEGFLDNGVKQSEGQFFTPMPICRFILQSLPLESLFANSTQPPKAIDYACGAGHFLNELASQITPFVKQHSHNTPQNYYQQFYGIEKEYRLSKVAKVSAFMYGQDEINILYHDALASHEKIENESFSVLVANPPYSVKGFLTTLDKNERPNYELFKTINEKSLESSNSIETFFLERAKQLLKSGGVAGIIVPSSILSNSDSTYTATRELLIGYFDIVAIVEFGSGTFGKTGTNTVVLFLRKKAQDPAPADHYRARVACWFDDGSDTDNEVYQDANLIKKYCQHIGIEFEDYQSLLKGVLSVELLATELFSDYKKVFNHSTEIKNLEKQKLFKDKTQVEKEIELKKRFLTFVQTIEKDKLYYFVLAFHNPQKVLVVKSPSDNKEQKKFLGYEWSAAKGSEGIKLTTDSNGHHITPLYDSTNRDNPEKINFLIAQNFLGNELDLNLPGFKNLEGLVSTTALCDMLDFSRVSFDKTISLTSKKSFAMETKWNIEKLENLMTIVRGASPRPIDKYLTNDENGVNWIKIGDVKEGDKYVTQTEEKITPEGAEKSRFVKEGDFILSNSMSSGRPYILKISGCIHDGWLLLSDFDKKLNTEYFYYLLSHYDGVKQQLSDNALGGIVKNLNIERVKSIQIPIPDKDIQEKIVAECEAIDKEVESAENLISLEEFNILNIINDKIINADFPSIKIGDLSEMSSGGTPLSSNKSFYDNGDIPWINSGEVSQGEIWQAEKYITELGLKNSSAKIFPAETVLLAMYGATAGKVGVLKIEACTNQAVCAIFPNDKYLPKFLYYQLKGMYDYLLSLRTGSARDNLSQSKIKEIKIKLPADLETQKTLVAEIETLENKIAEAQKIIDEAAAKKQAVLKHYL